jgi:acyl-CoA dehydrogenase
MTTEYAPRGPVRAELVDRARRIGEEVARKHADEVDRDARFPHEAVAALKEARLVGASVPAELGGLGASVAEIAAMCAELGRHCAATGVAFAMHHIQLACMARHGMASPFFRAYLAECAERQLVVASATSEVGVGGDMRSSVCAVERDGARFRLRKASSVLSYAEQADAILATARRAPDAPPADQVLVLLQKGQYELERTSTWDPLGMRGTCSPGYVTTGEAPVEQILDTPFGDIAAQTMVPWSHVTWTNAWLGIASDAVSRARAYVRADARRRPGTMPFGAARLGEVTSLLATMRATVFQATAEYDALSRAEPMPDRLTTIAYALEMNQLKISASQLVQRIALECLTICGMAGYANDSKFSMGRTLRDALGACLQVSNDRINHTNAGLLLVTKDDGR